MFDRKTQMGDSRFSHCRLRDGTCVAEQQRIIYRTPPPKCGYTLLKTIEATTMYGYMYQEKVESKMYVPGVTTNVTTLTLDAAKKQNLPVVILAEKEGVVLIRKEKIYDCEENLYRTNHPTIYLSKKKLQVNQ